MKTLKTGHIIRHRGGFRYKLIGEVENDTRGAHAKYSVVSNGRTEKTVLGPGFFPYDDYKVVRIGKIA